MMPLSQRATCYAAAASAPHARHERQPEVGSMQGQPELVDE